MAGCNTWSSAIYTSSKMMDRSLSLSSEKDPD